MKITDALNMLNISADATPAEIKKAYKRAAAKYHPDRNEAGAEMMKAVNEAYESLKDYTPQDAPKAEEFNANDYGEELNEALNAVINLAGIEIEICGAWIWLTGDTKPHKEIIKSAGFKWASKKKAWNYRPSDWKSASRGSYSMDDIRATHGSTAIKAKKNKAIKAA